MTLSQTQSQHRSDRLAARGLTSIDCGERQAQFEDRKPVTQGIFGWRWRVGRRVCVLFSMYPTRRNSPVKQQVAVYISFEEYQVQE
jgi:hypothetical protein